MQIQKQNAKAKANAIGEWFLCHKCGIYFLNSASKSDFSISECKYKGKMLMQMKIEMHRKMVFKP